jgi:polyphosphate kinase
MTEATIKESPPLIDRDLSWLEFNRRVLHEAQDARTPLLERLKFLAIFSSNLDEFFMKRIGVLTRHQRAEDASVLRDGIEYQHQRQLRERIVALTTDQADVFRNAICPELSRQGICLLTWGELSEDEKRQGNELFRAAVYPVLIPLVVDPSHPFPFMSNLSQSLGVLLKQSVSGETHFARIKVPIHVPAWLRMGHSQPTANNTGTTIRFVGLIDLIRANLDSLFLETPVTEVMPFRVTRTVEVEDDELEDNAESLIEQVTEELQQRRMEKVVRLQYEAPGSAAQLALLTNRLDVDDLHVYETPGAMDFTGYLPIAGLPRADLRDHPWEPLVPPALADADGSIFASIRKGDILVHHPYESFDASVARFIRSACEDPKVLAIKMTVYRIGSDTPFINSLIQAAETGKQVACLVEVTARFDEQQNIHWARVLNKVGIHVVYGILGLKTHAKTTLVIRNEPDGIRCYAHIGTGNYHVKTARLYSDLSLFTCDSTLTGDVVELFHALTGGSRKRTYHKLLVAPVNMRQRFLALIDREIEHCKAGRPARIIAKLNQLEDPALCEALVRASQAGVNVDLIVRGFCVLPPGVPGYTDHVRVISVIGRFLEHSRIYFFQNGQTDPLRGDYLIGSADWMERNLSRRVEAITPIEVPALRERLWQILQINLEDRRQAWDMRPDGTYVQRQPEPNDGQDQPASMGTHATLMTLALQSSEARSV